MTILMISATFPYPPTLGGTQIRTFYLMKYLAQRHRVWVVTQQNPDVTPEDVTALRQWVDRVEVFPRANEQQLDPSLWGKVNRFRQFLQQGTPPNVRFIHSEPMQQWIDQVVEQGQVQAITCEHSVNEVYVRPEWTEMPRVVNIHSSVYNTCRNQLATGAAERPLRDRLNLPLLKRYEQHYGAKFSSLVVTTEDDRHHLAALLPHQPIHVIPNGVELEQFPYRSTDPGGHHLVFVGTMDYTANIDAACFLAQEIFPEVRRRYPDATLALVGARPVEQVQALAQIPGVTVTGKVASMVKYLHRATVCVVPMRTGFGIKNKTLEAMAAGVPVVGSDRGLEGLAVDAPHTPLRALRANQGQEYVEAIARLFEDRTLRETLSKEGRSLIEQGYTWEQAGAAYERVVCPKR